MYVNKLIIASVLSLTFIPAFAATKVLSCMSINKAFHHCHLTDADQRDIRITRYKLGNCHLDNAWGVDSRGIWVDKGCGAEFEYGPVSRPRSSSTTVIIMPGFFAATLASAAIYNNSHYHGHHYHPTHHPAPHGHHGHHHR